MQSLETKSSRSFETETRPETFETETWKNGSRDTSRDSITVRYCIQYKRIDSTRPYL